MQSMKKASEEEVAKTSTSISKAGPNKQPDMTTWASEHLDAQSVDTDFCGPSLPPRFTQSVQSNHMAPSTRIFNPTTQILNPSTRNNLKGCVLPELRNTRTRRNTRFEQNTILSRLLQRKISPLSLSKSLLGLNRLLLSMTNNMITQTQFFTGR